MYAEIDPPIRPEDIQQSGIAYPTQWVPISYVCNCGLKVRADVKIVLGTQGGAFYQHCAKDTGKAVPGPLIAAWEEKDGSWNLVERFS